MFNLTIIKAVLSLHRGYTPRTMRNKFSLIVSIIRNWSYLKYFMRRVSKAIGKGHFEKLGISYVGAVQWPYISRCWKPKLIYNVMADHYELLANKCPNLMMLDQNDKLLLADLSSISNNCTLVLDRPVWFVREGELVINVFQNDLRVASLAFTFCHMDEKLCIFIGAIQGIHKGIDSAKSLEIYREITKACFGLRPRSLLIEVIKCIAKSLDVVHIYAVKDKDRHHRSNYFRKDKSDSLVSNYDEIWLDHNATHSQYQDFFELPIAVSKRELEDIPTRKRAMYRRRYDFLDNIFANVSGLIKNNLSK